MTISELTTLADELQKLVLSAVPKSSTVAKYGGTLYTLKPEEKEGQFCGIFVYKSHVQLAFSAGSLLEDPQKILSGTGKLRRHVNVKQSENIDKKALATLLRKAAKLSTARG